MMNSKRKNQNDEATREHQNVPHNQRHVRQQLLEMILRSESQRRWDNRKTNRVLAAMQFAEATGKGVAQAKNKAAK